MYHDRLGGKGVILLTHDTLSTSEEMNNDVLLELYMYLTNNRLGNQIYHFIHYHILYDIHTRNCIIYYYYYGTSHIIIILNIVIHVYKYLPNSAILH